MNYWFVQYNPDHFDGLMYLLGNAKRLNWWLIHNNNLPGRDKEIKQGDTAFIWKAKGTEAMRGIYGMAKVRFVPGKDVYDPYWHKYVKAKGMISGWRNRPTMDVLNIKLLCRPEDDSLLELKLRRILPKTGNIIKVLDNRYLQWNTMPLTKEEGEAIEAELKRLRGWDISP